MTSDQKILITSLEQASVATLFGTYSGIIRELRERKIVRTNNAPAGDYAEWLVLRALGADEDKLEPNSVKSHDLVDGTYGRIQVKGRVVSTPIKSGQLQTNPFRSDQFDHAAFVLFDLNTYEVKAAILLPVEAVKERWTWRKHINGRVVQMNGPTMNHPAAINIADEMRRAALREK